MANENETGSFPTIPGCEVQALLGRGGMGAVFKARQVGLDRVVALKVMNRALAGDPEFVKRFIIEARTAGKLRHENLVGALDCGEVGGNYFMIMEYVEGRTLSSILKEKGKIPESEALEWIKQVARGLEYAWNHKIIHRDIKPENIMVTREGVAKICDLGLCRSVTNSPHLTTTGMVNCTPSYASPEQGRGERDLDTRSDLYSLGVSLYQLVTGVLPFEGRSAGDVLIKHATEKPVPPIKRNPGLSPQSNDLILRMIEKDRLRRPATPAEVARIAEGILKGEVRPAPAVGPTSSPPSTRRRPPGVHGTPKRSALPFVVGGVAVAVALIVILLVSSSSRPPDPPDPLPPPKTAPQSTTAPTTPDRKETSRSPAIPAAGDLEPAKESERKDRLERFLVQIRSIMESPLVTERAEEIRSMLETAKKMAGADHPELHKLVADFERALLAANANPAPPATPEPIKAKISVNATLPPEEAWKNAVNLLPLIDPADGIPVGTWTMKDGKLWSDHSAYARIQAGYQPPEEYDFRIVFTRTDGIRDVAQILSCNGTAFLWVMGSKSNTAFGFGRLKGSWVQEPANPTSTLSPSCLENGRTHTSVVQVRKDGVKAYLDGKPITEWRTNYADLSPDSVWGPVDRTLLGLGSFQSVTAFHRAEVLEVSGKGRITRTPPKPGPSKPPTPGSSLIGHWKLDETGGLKAIDSSGRDLDGTLVGGPSWTWGRIGGSLRFDGGPRYVQVPLQEYKSVTNTFTVSLWVRPAASRTDGRRFALAPVHGGAVYGPEHAGVGLSVGTNGIGVFEHSDNYLPTVVSYDAPIAGWVSVSLVYQNRQPRLYVGGKLVAVGPASRKTVHPSPSIGGDPLGYGPFVGGIDDVRIHDRALSPAEIASLAKAPGQPVPESKKLSEADKVVKETFKVEYAKRTPPELQNLARKLLAQGRETEDSAGLRFVLLREARDLATMAGDSQTALSAIQELGNRFAVDSIDMSDDLLTLLSKVAKSPEGWSRLSEDYLFLAQRALDSDLVDAALAACLKAEQAARNQQNPSSVLRVQARRKELEEIRREQSKARTAEKTLESRPEDPDANTIAGRFSCFFRNNWDGGLPLLAKSADGALRTLADQELANPQDTAGRVRVGDNWWDLAEKYAGVTRASLQAHALDWYKRAWHQTAGDVRSRLRERFLTAQLRISGGKPGKAAPGGLPEWWSAGNEGSAADDSYARTGLRSIKIFRPVPESPGLKGTNSGESPVKAGDRLILSAWVLSDRTGSENLQVMVGGPGATENLSIPSDQPWWTYVERIITCPPGTVNLRVALLAWTPGGTYWVDDFSLRRLSDEVELIHNGSFER